MPLAGELAPAPQSGAGGQGWLNPRRWGVIIAVGGAAFLAYQVHGAVATYRAGVAAKAAAAAEAKRKREAWWADLKFKAQLGVAGVVLLGCGALYLSARLRAANTSSKYIRTTTS